MEPLHKRIKGGNVYGSRALKTSKMVSKKVRQRAKARFAARQMSGTSNLRTGGYIGMEVHYFDSALLSTALASNTAGAGGELDPSSIPIAGINCLFAPIKGTGPTNRIGDEVFIKDLYMRGTVTLISYKDAANAAPSADVFLAVILDTQTNGAQLNSEDVYVNPGGSNATGTSVFRNLQNRKRFRVLKVIRMCLNHGGVGSNTAPQTAFGAGEIKQNFELFVKVGKRVNFVGNAGTIADISDNSLHLIGWDDTTGATTNINYNARVRFDA